MTLTISRWAAAAAILVVGVLGGLAIGQVTRADSATAQRASEISVLNEINKKLGQPYVGQSALGRLDALARQQKQLKAYVGDPRGISGKVYSLSDRLRDICYAVDAQVSC